jgi:hypothetical protein
MMYSTCDAHYVDELRSEGWEDSMIQKYLDYRRKRSSTLKRNRSCYSDSTKSKVYSAEWAFQKIHGTGIQFKDYGEARSYLKRVLKSKLWKDLCKGHPRHVDIIEKRNVKRAATAGVSYGGRVQLDRNYGLNQYVLLHELAHECGNRHHDIQFRKDLIRLVSRFMGRAQAKCLLGEFRKKKLKMSRKQNIKTPEQWLAGYLKMEGLRQRKLPSAI